MAGLVAGYELLRAGHDLLIPEARHRIGGRVYTVWEPFADGLYAEAGAMQLALFEPGQQTYLHEGSDHPTRGAVSSLLVRMRRYPVVGFRVQLNRAYGQLLKSMNLFHEYLG